MNTSTFLYFRFQLNVLRNHGLSFVEKMGNLGVSRTPVHIEHVLFTLVQSMRVASNVPTMVSKDQKKYL